MVEQSEIPVLESQRQKDSEFKVVLDYTANLGRPEMLETLFQKRGGWKKREKRRRK